MNESDNSFLERAHLLDDRGFTPPIQRLAPPDALADVVRRYWLPVWSLPPGEVSVQRVLQYPVCLVVIGHDYASLIGPTTGLAVKELRDSGWAVGAMLQPAAGSLLVGDDVTTLTDRQINLTQSRLRDADALVNRVRTAVAPRPDDPGRQRAAIALMNEAFASLSPIDDEGLLVNRIVAWIEHDSGVQRVGQICHQFGITERSLQRLLARRVGLTPKWLIRRRRLHEAAQLLSSGATSLADLAAELGYADQAHFQRDFRTVTGMTPATYVAQRTAGQATESAPTSAR